MQIAYEILRILANGKFHSGTALAAALKVSRSSIWKGIEFLRGLNVNVQAVSGKGYRCYPPMELLFKSKIRTFLDERTREVLPRIDVVSLIPSTNDYLISRIAHQIPRGTVCLAEGQSAGRGRLGRQWRSPFGANIYLSLYWNFANKIHELSGLTLVIGMAILKALSTLGPLPAGLGIKWPNDIWYHNAKLCGILTECIPSSTYSSADVVIGIGMNINVPEMVLNAEWADVKRVFGFVPARNQLVAEILNKVVAVLLEFEKTGFAGFISSWPQYDLLAGREIILSAPHSERIIAQGVNERGELCIKVGNTLKAIRSGEVSIRPLSPFPNAQT